MDGRNTGRMGFSHAAEDSAENMMAAVKAGKIRKHLMGNNSPIRYGTMEKREMTEYTDFVRTKLCYEILNPSAGRRETGVKKETRGTGVKKGTKGTGAQKANRARMLSSTRR